MVDPQLNFPLDVMQELSESSTQLPACLQKHVALYAIGEAVPFGS
jgi:hypothetical protein